MGTYRALTVDWEGSNLKSDIREYAMDDLPSGEVTIRVAYSSINYKDGLSTIPGAGIISQYPHVPGIDLAGTVVTSSDPAFQVGDEVLITGYGLGASHPGGFSEFARVPAAWVVPMPPGLTAKSAMAIGTAGFTAALSVHRMEENGLKPNQGPILVSGATGGVGSWAVTMLAQSGYEVTASTRKSSEIEYLKKLGARETISPAELEIPEAKSLYRERWAGAVDPVGGPYLTHILNSVRYGGSVTLSGFTGGSELVSTVLPFILRGVNLLGIDSVLCPMDVRRAVWNRIATEWKPDEVLLDSIVKEISLSELPEAITQVLQGRMRGRSIVALS
ncbi:acryloyl-CoA reductase [Paenibacillus oryzisoli]|uniref:Quinone oxidoreductase n=1 Tax=Paenibacillus oryzisoli TaxID=1850517 RepID=A0A198A8G5_9BACL|nr:acryloyl-CoA reductase [Paenibacillus oryzisoli]OAS17366.1 quinone oxidoreductase [Paenibacillus oryzisoli]